MSNKPKPSKFAGMFNATQPATNRQRGISESSGQRGPGRPRGKRSDPAYEQITAYIRKDTHRSVKIVLLEGGDERDVSDLVEELLAEWLQTHT